MKFNGMDGTNIKSGERSGQTQSSPRKVRKLSQR